MAFVNRDGSQIAVTPRRAVNLEQLELEWANDNPKHWLFLAEFRLYHGEDWPLEYIARAHGVPRSTVMRRIAKTRESLERYAISHGFLGAPEIDQVDIWD